MTPPGPSRPGPPARRSYVTLTAHGHAPTRPLSSRQPSCGRISMGDQPRKAPRLRRRIEATVAAAALMTLGMASPAVASVAARSSSAPMAAGLTGAASGPAATPAAAPVSPKSKHAAALCGPAKKGMARCFAERRTDVVPHKGFQALAAVQGYGPADLAS